MIRASLCAVAVIALCAPSRALSRRKNAPTPHSPPLGRHGNPGRSPRASRGPEPLIPPPAALVRQRLHVRLDPPVQFADLLVVEAVQLHGVPQRESRRAGIPRASCPPAP